MPIRPVIRQQCEFTMASEAEGRFMNLMNRGHVLARGGAFRFAGTGAQGLGYKHLNATGGHDVAIATTRAALAQDPSLHYLFRFATLARYGRNTQPLRFRVAGDRVGSPDFFALDASCRSCRLPYLQANFFAMPPRVVMNSAYPEPLQVCGRRHPQYRKICTLPSSRLRQRQLTLKGRACT